MEDLVQEEEDVQSRVDHALVLPRVRRRAKTISNSVPGAGGANKVGGEEQEEAEQQEEANQKGDVAGHFLPGRASVYIKTWGCSHNNSDGEYMAGQLAAEGYTVTSDRDNAKVWILNSCTVKNPSQDVFMNQVREGAICFVFIFFLSTNVKSCLFLFQGFNRGVKVVVAGCVPQGERKNKELKDLSMIGVQQIDRVVEVVEQAIQGNVVRLTASKKTAVHFFWVFSLLCSSVYFF